MSYDVYDFLITDARLADELDAGGRCVDEKLLIAEEADAASISLYLGQGLMERLRDNNPAYRLSADNLEDFWTALEGVSHFIYYAWNATAEKSVTLLEMELQAEVDKFIGTTLLLRQQGESPPPNLHLQQRRYPCPTLSGDGPRAITVSIERHLRVGDVIRCL